MASVGASASLAAHASHVPDRASARVVRSHNGETRDAHERPRAPAVRGAGVGARYAPPRDAIFAQVSRSVTVRLNTSAPGFESSSTQK